MLCCENFIQPIPHSIRFIHNYTQLIIIKELIEKFR